MSDNSKYWLFFFCIVGTVILSIAGTLSVYSNNKVKLIAASADPVATACAIDADSFHTTPTCVIYVQKLRSGGF